MIDDFAKAYLHDDLRWIRRVMLSRLDGLSEYDVRRPLTVTGTNLLGLVKHLAATEARYFGEIFGRTPPQPLPPWEDPQGWADAMWATEDESREEILERYRRACEFTDATIEALPIDAEGHVPWWPRPNVMLFNIMVHVLTETSRHAGHADILREGLDGTTGDEPQAEAPSEERRKQRERHVARVERAARAVSATPGTAPREARGR